MITSDNIIKEPESITEVSKLIGANTRDLGMLCKHRNVNMWAKYKPIKYNKTDALTEAEFRSVNFGLKVDLDYVVNALSTANGASIEDAISNAWEYEMPEGGASSPYRLSDFTNYHHTADTPLEAQVPIGGFSVNKSARNNITVYVTEDPDREFMGAYDIQGYDLRESGIDLRKFELIWVLKKGSEYKYVGRANATVLDQDGEIDCDAITVDFPDDYGTGDFDLFIGLARWNEQGRNYTIIPLPNGGVSDRNRCPFKVNVVNDPIGGGGGIDDALEDVSFSYSMDGTFKVADECVDEGNPIYAVKNMHGDVFLKVKMKNTASSGTVLHYYQIRAFVNERGVEMSADRLLNEDKTSVSSVTIPSNGEVTCYIGFSGLLNWYTSATPMNIEMDIYRTNTGSNVTIWNGALWYCHGADSWHSLT